MSEARLVAYTLLNPVVAFNVGFDFQTFGRRPGALETLRTGSQGCSCHREVKWLGRT